ncbi:MAG: hypothetical protein LBU00_00200 [Treponema sp.]|nr:hypothetical protein [Treponema sp.]
MTFFSLFSQKPKRHAGPPHYICVPFYQYGGRIPQRRSIITRDKSTDPITWHTAFRDGIQLTFLPYRDVLSFEFECPLNTEPLRIDAVIIKKRPKAVIDRPLGAIFRRVNIVEYKSPGDYLAVADYHKAWAYARLYSVLKNIALRDMTVTFVVESFPRKLLVYLTETCGYEVTKKWPGIYQLKDRELGGMQIVETKKLREEDGGVWLRDLRGGLKREELGWILEESKKMPEGTPLAAYLWMVMGANRERYKEVIEMASEFEKLMEECGFAAKWKDEGRKEIARNALAEGISPNTISKITGLDIKTVKRLAAEPVPLA